MLAEVFAGIVENLDVEAAGEVMMALKSIMEALIEAQSNRDMLLIADLLDADMVPVLAELSTTMAADDDAEDISFFSSNFEALASAGEKELCSLVRNCLSKTTENIYEARLSESGDVILFQINEEKEIGLMGRHRPFQDAVSYFYSNRRDECVKYAVAGANMIYEALAILKINVGTPVYILEDDIALLTQILTWYDLSEAIRSGRLRFIFKDVLKSLPTYFENQSLLVNSTSLMNTGNDQVRRTFEKYRQITLTVKEQNYLLEYNFSNNTELEDDYVSTLLKDYAGKTIYLVAGGPSLTPCMELLKEKRSEDIILCVGTSAGKLLKEGIQPEYVIISDPLPEIAKQVDHPFDMERTSLIYLSTTCSAAAHKFSGKRYIAFQEGFEKAEKRAKELDVPTYKTGGSVATLAMDIAISFEPLRIICLGLDLAYTNNQMHASGIHEVNESTGTETGRMVKSVSGNMISTAQTLETYHKWIEDRLCKYDGKTEIVNVSDGAFIKGMKNIPTSDMDTLFC